MVKQLYTELGDHTFLRKRAKLKRYSFCLNNIQGSVLELGCGDGSYLMEHPGYLGIDKDPFLVQGLISKGYKVFEMDVENLNFPDKTFDTVVFMEVIEHLNDPYKTLDKVFRILKDDGILIISTPNKRVILRGYDNPFHKKMFTYKELLGVLSPNFDFVYSKGIFVTRIDFPFCRIIAPFYEFFVPMALQPLVFLVMKKRVKGGVFYG